MNWMTATTRALIATAMASAALADDCAVVKAATIAAAKTSHTLNQNVTMNSKTTTRSIIQTRTISFVQDGGKWHALSLSAEQRVSHLPKSPGPPNMQEETQVRKCRDVCVGKSWVMLDPPYV